MKKDSFSFTILLIISLTCSVSCHSNMESPSPFLRNFSLVETVRRMNFADFGTMSAGLSGGSSAGAPTSRRNESDYLFTIVESKIENFDERDFLLKLKQQVSNEVSNAGLRVTGGGGSGDTFHIEYESTQFKGGIDIIGIRAEKDKYRVWCVVRELASGETQKL
jgi:hypothetical protein